MLGAAQPHGVEYCCTAASNLLPACEPSMQNYGGFFDAGAIGMDVQTALFGLVLWCTPSLLLLICLVLRTPAGFDSDKCSTE
jgi:hypothetical protein